MDVLLSKNNVIKDLPSLYIAIASFLRGYECEKEKIESIDYYFGNDLINDIFLNINIIYSHL